MGTLPLPHTGCYNLPDSGNTRTAPKPMRPLTPFEQYVAGAEAHYLQNPGQRRGQAYMNHLLKVCSGLYHSIPQGEGIDPFYVDANIPVFLQYVGEKWDVYNHQ